MLRSTVKKLSLSICVLAVVFLPACASSTPRMTPKQQMSALQNGKNNFLAKQYDLAFQQLLPVARLGNPEAQYAVGYMYYYGKGVQEDSEAAEKWIKRSSEQHFALAQQAYAEILEGKKTEKQTSNPIFAEKSQPARKSSKSDDSWSLSTDNNKTETIAQKNNVEPKKTAIIQSTKQTPKIAKTPVNTEPSKKNSLNQAANKSDPYSIQLLGVRTLEEVQQFLTKNQLTSNASYLKTQYQGKDWFVILYGHYATSGEAKSALGELPAQLKNLNPWVRRVVS